MPAIALPAVSDLAIRTKWRGQDGTAKVGPGDVHVEIEGLPGAEIAGAVLSDEARGVWSAKYRDAPAFDGGAWSVPLNLARRAEDPSRADLHFPPFRDETGGKMTLRLIFADGRAAVAVFEGGKADPGLRARPRRTRSRSRPGPGTT